MVPDWELASRVACRFVPALVLVLGAFTAGVRVRAVLLTRSIHAVLSGLQQIRIDQTTEGQLLRTVPYLVRYGEDRIYQSSVGRRYMVNISNDSERRSLWRLASSRPIQFLWRWPGMDRALEPLEFQYFPFRVAYWLGWRHTAFAAYVTLRDGRVSKIWYGVDPDIEQGSLHGYLVSAQSTHGFWRGPGVPVSVSSVDDQRPEFHVSGGDRGIYVTYATDAAPEMIAHAFQVDLNCFWSIRGCVSARQVAPLLWKDKQTIGAEAVSRLKSQSPCPDKVVAGRVRHLPDLNVALLEVVTSGSGDVNEDGTHSREIITTYQLKEAIRGAPVSPGRTWAIGKRRHIPSPIPDATLWPDPVAPQLKPGTRVLYFSGADFDSCRVVLATPSAESAVRTAVPAPRLSDDEMITWSGK